jgi:quercetin dioxygenase-like cupin family protein
MPGPLTDWRDVDELAEIEGLRRRTIAGEGSMLMRVELDAGTVVPAHRHEQEQFTIVLSGRMRFLVGEEGEEREHVAGPGTVVHCPGDVRHAAEALEPTVEIDVFTPVRPELLPPSPHRS